MRAVAFAPAPIPSQPRSLTHTIIIARKKRNEEQREGIKEEEKKEEEIKAPKIELCVFHRNLWLVMEPA